jgi:hypothetical protein
MVQKTAILEGRWHDEQPAGKVLVAIPDPASEAKIMKSRSRARQFNWEHELYL